MWGSWCVYFYLEILQVGEIGKRGSGGVALKSALKVRIKSGIVMVCLKKCQFGRSDKKGEKCTKMEDVVPVFSF